MIVKECANMRFALLEIKAQVDAMWERMDKGVSNKILRRFTSSPNSTGKKSTKKTSSVRLSSCHFTLSFFFFLKEILWRCFLTKYFHLLLLEFNFF